MGVYSTVLADEILLKSVEGCARVVIIGCMHCANNSIALVRDIPLKKVAISEKTGKPTLAPAAITEEANRIKMVLETRVKEVNVQVAAGLCDPSIDQRAVEPGWVNLCNLAQAVIALCCAAGVVGLKYRIEKTVRIIPGMKSEGFCCIFTTFDKARGCVCIDKTRSQIIRMNA
jgi:hypothetical protein